VSAAFPLVGTVMGMTSIHRGTSQLDSLVDEAALAAATDIQLWETTAAIISEQRRRALADDDLATLVEEAFENGFNGRGEPHPPWLVGPLLVCPGSKRNRSATSHDCTFVSVDGTWVWDSEEKIIDEMRDFPGPKTQKRTVTVIGAVEGLKLDLVASSSRSGAPCEMKTATSFEIQRGQLIKVATRARKPAGHR
jgi:hypothetical protein